VTGRSIRESYSTEPLGETILQLSTLRRKKRRRKTKKEKRKKKKKR